MQGPSSCRGTALLALQSRGRTAKQRGPVSRRRSHTAILQQASPRRMAVLGRRSGVVARVGPSVPMALSTSVSATAS
eukprot:6187367-Pyramimonas_sp.AAC.1